MHPCRFRRRLTVTMNCHNLSQYSALCVFGPALIPISIVSIPSVLGFFSTFFSPKIIRFHGRCMVHPNLLRSEYCFSFSEYCLFFGILFIFSGYDAVLSVPPWLSSPQWSSFYWIIFCRNHHRASRVAVSDRPNVVISGRRHSASIRLTKPIRNRNRFHSIFCIRLFRETVFVWRLSVLRNSLGALYAEIIGGQSKIQRE